MYTNILVPISFQEDAKTETALKLTEVLGSPGARVTLLHVMEPIPVYAESYVPAEYFTESKTQVEADLQKLVATLPNASGVVVTGHAGSAILDQVDTGKVDCIIIASHRPGLADYFLGGTAAHVVRHAKCSVHVVR